MGSILIIEDERDTVDLVEHQLKESGFHVLTALDGISGLELAVKKCPDLVILDLMLPRMEGQDVCRTLKFNPRTRGIPIMILTALAGEDDRIAGYELGVDDYITKPFSPRELVLRVKAILRRKESTREVVKIIQIDDLLVDIDRHRVSVQGTDIHLTLTEFKLLVELASNRRRVLTRERLLDRVWGFDFEGYDRTVDAHIRQLRKKLGGLANYIETIRGAGYKFREKNES
jgi:two-component system phosphate regulon response regulator PhoB